MQETYETQVRSLGWEDALEEGMTTHSSILAWRIPRTEEPVAYSPQGQRAGHNWSDLAQHIPFHTRNSPWGKSAIIKKELHVKREEELETRFLTSMQGYF